METLVIKNFGPVKDAEIALKKVNIFIGPQGSGKSIITKVMSGAVSYTNNQRAGSTDRNQKEKFLEELNLFNCLEADTSIFIRSSEGIEMLIDGNEYTSLAAEPSPSYYGLPATLYVPAERTVIPLIAGSSFFFSKEKTPLSRHIADFGLLFQNARTEVKSQTFEFLDGITYHFRDGADVLELKNGKTIRLQESSSGLKAIVPLLIVLSWLTSRIKSRAGNKTIYLSIEEPELSLFPFTQNELLKFIFEKIAPLNYHLTITTHSPYTLTAINNFIYAYQVGNKDKSVQEIVPEKLWLNPDDVGAWFVEEGKVRSIIDDETKQIKAEEIDRISEVLNEEYDRIADIKFK
ncbi:ATP-binding protein [Pseudoflavitalea sp. X16]|uniref:AAA family ATPase n=1 Tax=Paraflavitalea devenefica TaxID=2716334 RepID=UPI0014249F33|nr:AAA family ATPase [Paraflavitalea devenefica]NII25037.1 ATP-binding protein [Paraflavitalea devenefica]